LALLLAALLAGCDRPSPPPIAPIPPKGNTPEAKLERVIQRLEFALDSAKGSPDFGVKSERDSQHRLIPPSDDEPRYTAEVIIATQRTVTAANGGKAPANAQGKGEKADAKAERPKATSNVETEKFLLVYEDDRWTLPEEPESETLRICFESALKEE